MSLEKEVGHITEFPKDSFVEWKIKGFFLQSSKGHDYWRSPKFCLADATWHLDLYLIDMISRETVEWIGLYLVMEKYNTKKHTVMYKLGLKTFDGNVDTLFEDTRLFEQNDVCGCSSLLKKGEFSQKKNILAPDDVVTVYCEIRLAEHSSPDTKSQPLSENDLSGLSRDLKELFLSGDNADVTIKVRGEEFRAHTQILAARSSVLDAMFKHDMKEKNTGVVNIEDCDPEAFRVFLKFLYSGILDGVTTSNVFDLYGAAEKYGVKKLKTMRKDFMKKAISIDTFCDVVSLALTHGDTELKDHGIEYFVKNTRKIIVTAKWMSFAKEHVIESNELIIKTFNTLSTD